MIFHEEERKTIVPFSEIVDNRQSEIWTVIFSDGESYDVTYFSEGETADFDAEPIDEYYEMYFDIVAVHHDGPRRYNNHLSQLPAVPGIDYCSKDG